jgi:8-oxo-dGTP pyrophosphatase MutT (NUDIX family)
MSAKIIIASGPVIVEEGKVLLNKHGDTAFWKFCGGRVDDFETDLIANAKREVKEEMGIDILIKDERPFIVHVKKEDGDEKIDVILAHFLAERIGEIMPGSDIREWKWIDLKSLPTDLAPNIFPTLKHFGFLS